MNCKIRAEKPGDVPGVREVNRLAFGRENEARLVDNLRSGTHARISLVASREDRIIGYIMFRVHFKTFDVGAWANVHAAQTQKHWPNTILSLLAGLYSSRVLKCTLSALSIKAERGSVEALALAPVAVVPEAQGQGIGSALIQEGLRR